MQTKVTGSNVNAAKRDDKAHMTYLKEDINYDYKHGGSNKRMTKDEIHITNLAKDVKYDDKIKPVAAMYGGPKMGAKKGDQSKTRLDYEAPTKMYNGPKMETNAQEKKNLMMDNPIDTRASVGGPQMKAGSWMSKHINRM